MKVAFGLILCLVVLGVCSGREPVTPDPGWVEEALRRHNEFRRGFNAPPLKLSEKLCNSSLQFARELADKADRSDLEHSLWAEQMGFGENIYRAKGRDVEIYGSTPVDRWYDEIENYLKRKDKDNELDEDEFDDAAIGSFTQIVWKETAEMCVSYAATEADDDGKGTLYIVAHYLPRGNTHQEEENVMPNLTSPYFYKDSETAPQHRHLSDPIGSDGQLIPSEPEHPERSCWKENDWQNSEKNAKEVTTPSEFIEEALNVTNKLRHHHRVHRLPMIYEECTLCKSAQGWANALASNGTPDWTDGKNSACGVMIFKSKEFVSAHQVIWNWYNEGHNYEFDHHRTSTGESPANFVRLIWKGTEQLCVAFAKKESTNEFIYVGVIFQNPKPNYDDLGARKENVFSAAAIGALANLLIFVLGTLVSSGNHFF